MIRRLRVWALGVVLRVAGRARRLFLESTAVSPRTKSATAAVVCAGCPIQGMCPPRSTAKPCNICTRWGAPAGAEHWAR
jgi:hypothetical protein